MKAVLSKYTQRDLLFGIDWFDRISFGLGDEFEV